MFNRKRDDADERDAITFANTYIFDQSAMEDMEEEWLFRDGCPDRRAKVRPKKLRRCAGCGQRRNPDQFSTVGKKYLCRCCAP